VYRQVVKLKKLFVVQYGECFLVDFTDIMFGGLVSNDISKVKLTNCDVANDTSKPSMFRKQFKPLQEKAEFVPAIDFKLS